MALKRLSGVLEPSAKRSRVDIAVDSDADEGRTSDELASFDDDQEEQDGGSGLAEAYSDGEEDGFEDLEAEGKVEPEEGPPQAATQQKGKQKAGEEAVDVQAAGSRQAFGLQADSLLSSVTPPYAQHGAEVDELVARLKDILSKVAEEAPAPLAKSRRLLKNKGVELPLRDPEEEVQWKAGFAPPADVWIAGSWKTRCGIKGERGQRRNGSVDVMVEMPTTLFQDKDYLAFRYFHKRSHYLAHLASALSSSSISSSFELSYSRLHPSSWSHSHLQPVILLAPRSETPLARAKLIVRLIPCYAGSPFPLSHLAPHRANLRPTVDRPTPIYNQLVQLDSARVQRAHAQVVQEACRSHKGFSGLVRLIKVWARMRGLHEVAGLDGWGWGLPLLLAHAVGGGGLEHIQGRKEPKGAACLARDLDLDALFRAVMDWLSQRLAEPRVTTSVAPGEVGYPLEDWGPDPLLVDPTGRVNLLANLPTASRILLCHEAQTTLTLLRSPLDVFESLFLDPRAGEFALKYDNQFAVELSAADAARLASPAYVTGDKPGAAKVVTDVLSAAIGGRAKALAVISTTRAIDTPLSSAPTDGGSTLRIGLVLDPILANALVTRGPAPDADPKGAAEFRAMWGKKAELRRFNDGAIVESVVWQASDPLERAKVTSEVVKWALTEKLGIAPAQVSALAGPYDGLLQEGAAHVKSAYRKDPKVVGFTAVMTAFDQLVKDLKGLDKLPLGITDVKPVSPALRYSSVFIPGAVKTRHPVPSSASEAFQPALDAHLVFESSGKWPDDLEAAQKVKAAFLARIAEAMLEARHATTASVAVTDERASPVSDHFALEVVHSAGIAFRLRIHHEREAQLLDAARQGPDPTLAKLADRSMQLYRRRFVDLPKHHAAISALQTRCPTLTYAIRTTKRWLSSHLIHPDLLPPESVELVCAAAYLSVGPYSDAPGSGATGFARVLSLLATWNWQTTPLLVPIFTAAGLDPSRPAVFPLDLSGRAGSAFALHRRADPSVSRAAWYVATENELEGKGPAWEAPGKLVAGRIRTLAQGALKALQAGLDGGFGAETLFRTPKDGYDFRLALKSTTRGHQAIEPPTKTRASSTAEGPGLDRRLDYDPVSAFVARVEDAFGDAVVLFFDEFGGTEVFGLFNPSYLAPRSFKPSGTLPMTPIEGGKVVLDRTAVLEEMARLGDGMVGKIVASSWRA